MSIASMIAPHSPRPPRRPITMAKRPRRGWIAAPTTGCQRSVSASRRPDAREFGLERLDADAKVFTRRGTELAPDQRMRLVQSCREPSPRRPLELSPGGNAHRRVIGQAGIVPADDQMAAHHLAVIATIHDIPYLRLFHIPIMQGHA